MSLVWLPRRLKKRKESLQSYQQFFFFLFSFVFNFIYLFIAACNTIVATVGVLQGIQSKASESGR